MKTPQMDISFIDRTLRTTGFLALIFLPFGFAYLEASKVLSVLSGLIWGMVNLYFLAVLIKVTVRPEGPDKRAALLLMFIKLPLIYLAGYFLLTNSYFNVYYLLIGFTVLFIVIVLKVLGRLLLGLDNNDTSNNNHPQREAV